MEHMRESRVVTPVFELTGILYPQAEKLVKDLKPFINFTTAADMHDESQAYDGAEHDITEDKPEGFRLHIITSHNRFMVTQEMTAILDNERIKSFSDVLTIFEYLAQNPEDTYVHALEACFHIADFSLSGAPDSRSLLEQEQELLDQGFTEDDLTRFYPSVVGNSHPYGCVCNACDPYVENNTETLERLELHEHAQVSADFTLTESQLKELCEYEGFSNYKDMIPVIELLDRDRSLSVSEAIATIYAPDMDNEQDSWSDELHENQQFEQADQLDSSNDIEGAYGEDFPF